MPSERSKHHLRGEDRELGQWDSQVQRPQHQCANWSGGLREGCTGGQGQMSGGLAGQREELRFYSQEGGMPWKRVEDGDSSGLSV